MSGLKSLFGAIAVLVCIVGLVGCALFLRLGLDRGDWLLTLGALLIIGAFLYAVVWLGEAL